MVLLDMDEEKMADIISETITKTLQENKQHAIRTIRFILKCHPDLIGREI